MKRHTGNFAFSLALCILAMSSAGCGWLGRASGTGHGVSESTDDPADISAALAAAGNEMTLAPTEPYWPYRIGALYAAADSSQAAARYLARALEVDPSYAPAVSLLSKLYFDAADYDRGIDLLDGFIVRNPDAPDALRAALALNLEARGDAARGDTDRAAAVLRDCSAGSRDARSARAFVCLHSGDVAASMDAAARALEADPDNASNRNNYGVALLMAGKPAEARGVFTKVLELQPDMPDALYNLAIVDAFYFFDEAAGRRWFARYRQLAAEDPDNLASTFATDLSKAQE